MKIQYCSDIHLEFEHNNKYINEINPLKVSGEVLLLAGDITLLSDSYIGNSFFDFVSKNYKQVFWIPGNHEYYHSDISNYIKPFNIKIRENVSLVNNQVIEFEGVRFVFSTLWSEIIKNPILIENGVSDFTYILLNKKKLRVSDFNQLYYDSFNFIKDSLQIHSHLKTVVVSHHLPSKLCNSAQYNNSPINEAFCVDLTQFIESCNANFWVYGHSHFNQKPLIIGKTILVTNQLGYVKNNEHYSFKNDCFFSV